MCKVSQGMAFIRNLACSLHIFYRQCHFYVAYRMQDRTSLQERNNNLGSIARPSLPFVGAFTTP